MAIFPCPIYLEWTKASLRTALPQNTREQLLLEVATTYKIKTVVKEKFNIFIFIFSYCGMKQMKQTVKHSVENFSKNIAIIEYLIECPPHHERLNNT